MTGLVFRRIFRLFLGQCGCTEDIINALVDKKIKTTYIKNTDQCKCLRTV